MFALSMFLIQHMIQACLSDILTVWMKSKSCWFIHVKGRKMLRAQRVPLVLLADQWRRKEKRKREKKKRKIEERKRALPQNTQVASIEKFGPRSAVDTHVCGTRGTRKS